MDESRNKTPDDQESIQEADFNPLISLAGSLKIPIMLGSVLFLTSSVAVSQVFPARRSRDVVVIDLWMYR